MAGVPQTSESTSIRVLGLFASRVCNCTGYHTPFSHDDTRIRCGVWLDGLLRSRGYQVPDFQLPEMPRMVFHQMVAPTEAICSTMRPLRFAQVHDVTKKDR